MTGMVTVGCGHRTAPCVPAMTWGMWTSCSVRRTNPVHSVRKRPERPDRSCVERPLVARPFSPGIRDDPRESCCERREGEHSQSKRSPVGPYFGKNRRQQGCCRGACDDVQGIKLQIPVQIAGLALNRSSRTGVGYIDSEPLGPPGWNPQPPRHHMFRRLIVQEIERFARRV